MFSCFCQLNKGMNVDFDVNNNNEAIAIFVLASNKYQLKSKHVFITKTL